MGGGPPLPPGVDRPGAHPHLPLRDTQVSDGGHTRHPRGPPAAGDERRDQRRPGRRRAVAAGGVRARREGVQRDDGAGGDDPVREPLGAAREAVPAEGKVLRQRLHPLRARRSLRRARLQPRQRGALRVHAGHQGGVRPRRGPAPLHRRRLPRGLPVATREPRGGVGAPVGVRGRGGGGDGEQRRPLRRAHRGRRDAAAHHRESPAQEGHDPRARRERVAANPRGRPRGPHGNHRGAVEARREHQRADRVRRGAVGAEPGVRPPRRGFELHRVADQPGGGGHRVRGRLGGRVLSDHPRRFTFWPSS
mmetsp:Transcript_32259/g.68716  ORF Transcript_32259/g.68716 Transcript_32259/m.68716 type:complete len:306 (+) Transcript_32259:90-1007(+)